MTLRRAGEPFALRPSDLLRSAMVTSGAVTNRVDRLHDKGFVERSATPGDRRSTSIRLTEEGLRTVDRLIEEHLENERRLLSALPRRDADTLADLLRQLHLAVLDAPTS